MKQISWFDRKFDFSFDQNIFPSIVERLKGTPIRLIEMMKSVSPEHLTFKVEGKWSVLEHIGHLIDLEPLWLGRFEDIKNKKRALRPADLENKKTYMANHNQKGSDSLLKELSEVRMATVIELNKLTEKEIYQASLHPRLNTPMRVMDLFLFAAEHDDHHLACIAGILKDRQLAE